METGLKILVSSADVTLKPLRGWGWGWGGDNKKTEISDKKHYKTKTVSCRRWEENIQCRLVIFLEDKVTNSNVRVVRRIKSNTVRGVSQPDGWVGGVNVLVSQWNRSKHLVWHSALVRTQQAANQVLIMLAQMFLVLHISLFCVIAAILIKEELTGCNPVIKLHSEL